MKITLITGNHPRHQYLVNEILKYNKDISWITQIREEFIPKPSNELSQELKKLHSLHFDKRANAENNILKIENKDNLNESLNPSIIIKEDFKNREIYKIIKNLNSDLLITYGISKIEFQYLKELKIKAWNIHGGLSPWYKGVMTHFWPSYLLEPQYTGFTLHEITENIDAGPIIHQTSIEINVNDGLHENACKALNVFAKDFSKKLSNIIDNNSLPKGISSKTTGRIWTTKMWNPSHLKLIYDVYEDKINKYCIENNLIKDKPKLISIL